MGMHVGGMNKRKDPNAMDVDALTMEERGMLLRQGKCFHCKRTGHGKRLPT
jgi:ribosomal protein S6E (S10)